MLECRFRSILKRGKTFSRGRSQLFPSAFGLRRRVSLTKLLAVREKKILRNPGLRGPGKGGKIRLR